MTILFSNNAETTLQVAALVADTTMTVKAGDSGLFNVLAAGQTELVTLTDGVNYEVIEITAWAGDVATVIRGVEGTAQAWGIGTLFSGRVTAGALAKMAQTADTVRSHTVRAADATTVTVDLSALYPNPLDMPPYILVPPATTGITNITLPSLPMLQTDQVFIVDIRKFVSGSARINLNVKAGDYILDTLNGSDFMLNSMRARLLGYFDGTATHWSW